MLDTIRKAFGLCTCAVSPKMVDKSRGAPKWHSCFDDYLQNCSGDWDDEVYQETIEKVERLLSGKTGDLIREVKDEMEIASQSLEFEKAARLRDSMKSLEKYNQKMKIVANKEVHRDVFAIDVDEELGEACGVLFKIREGKLIGKFNRFLKNIEDRPRSVMMQSFVEDYYTGQMVGAIPDEVYLSNSMEDDDPLLEYLWEQRGKKVPIHVPQIGEKKHLIEMAITNARLNLGERKLEKQKAERDRIPQAIKDLKDYLKLDRLPRRIECFDNSNTQGTDPVASMVCFVDGQPRKSEYKRFKIKTVTGADDYASMKEIVKRRYSKVKKEKLHTPDLILIDGGKGQLNAALDALEEIDFRDVGDVAGLAKRLEEVFLPQKADPVMIPKTSSALKLLQRARDEAHRFAITYHRQKRSKRTLKTGLTEIDGVGEKTAQKLLKAFGSVDQIKKADADSLKNELGKKLGEKVYRHFLES